MLSLTDVELHAKEVQEAVEDKCRKEHNSQHVRTKYHLPEVFVYSVENLLSFVMKKYLKSIKIKIKLLLCRQNKLCFM